MSPQSNAVAVIGNDGAMHEQVQLTVETKRIANFVEAYRKEYFEDHSMEWCLDAIIERGIAEIKRYVKTNDARKKQMAAGSLVKEFGLSIEQAKAVLTEALAAKRIAKSA